MRVCLSILVLSVAVGAGGPAVAASPTDTLSTCLADTLNGKERKLLAKWIFFAIAAHPEISSYSTATPADTDATDKAVGTLITRLLTTDCPEEFKAANESDPRALEKAFEVVGRVAMQELMANDAVKKAITDYSKYADMERINAVLAQD